MGNIFSININVELRNHLNDFRILYLSEDDHIKLRRFKFGVEHGDNKCHMYTTYDYQTIDYNIATDFILCQSSSIDKIIENVKLGKESLAYLKWDFHEGKDMFMLKNILDEKISCYKVDLIEIHVINTLKSCKTLRYHKKFNAQDDKSYFKENDIIDCILYQFMYYPLQKKLLLTTLIMKDIQDYIFNIYIQQLYVLPNINS